MKYIQQLKERFFGEGREIELEFFKASFLSFISTAFAQGVTFVCLTYLARQLGETLFGEFSMVYNACLFLSVLTIFGMNMTLTKLISEYREQNNHPAIAQLISFSYQLVFFIALTVLLTIVAFPKTASTILCARPELSQELLLGSLYLFFFTLSTIQFAIITGFKYYRYLAISNFAKGFLFSLILWGAFYKDTRMVFAILSGVFGGYTLLNEVLLKNIYKRFHLKINVWNLKFLKPDWEVIGKYALPYFLAGLFVFPVTWLTNRMLAAQPQGFAELGAFNAAYQWRTIMIFVPMTLANVVVPMISSAYTTKDYVALRKIMKISILISAAVGLILCLMIIAFNPYIKILYGEDFNISTELLVVTAITTFLIASQIPVGNLINATGEMWIGFLMNFGWAVLIMGSAYFFIEQGWGSEGLAYAYLIAYSIHCIWTFWFGVKKVYR